MTARRILCLLLVFSQIGCRSVYRLHCTSNPTPAGVLAGQDFLGETECTIKIPKDSKWIQDGQIELTFALPNGQEQKHVVDLRRQKPSNPLAETVAWPFMIGGFGLVWVGQADNDGFYSDNSDQELTWLGLAAIGIGAGLYLLFGGDFDSRDPLHVHVDFNVSGEGQ